MKNVNKIVTPPLKWVGGKRGVLPELKEFYKNIEFNEYYEPFFGGGSVYFDIINTFGSSMKNMSHINDMNEDLMNVFRHIKENPEGLISVLDVVIGEYNNLGYYVIRNRFNGLNGEIKITGIKRSATLILLNKTGFNGLYRTNRSGFYNVPEGNYKNPKIYSKDNIIGLSKVLPPVENIHNLEFDSFKDVKPGDLVYLDPPYHPITETSSFTEYIGPFGSKDQVRLFEYFKELDDKGVYVILSNSTSEFILELYKDYEIKTVYRSGTVNSDKTKRGSVPEVIIIGNTLKNILKK